MIKRFNKIVALVLLATSLAAVTPTTFFSKIANAAETNEGQALYLDTQKNVLAAGSDQNTAIMQAIQKYLVSQYSSKGCVMVKIVEPAVTSIPLVITDKMAGDLADKIVTDEFAEQQILKTMGVNKEQAKYAIKAKAQAQGITLTDDQVEAKYNEMIQENKPTVVSTVKSTILNLNGQSIPVYQYAAIAADGSIVGKGYVIGGPVASVLLETGKPIYVDADTLNNSVIGQLKEKIEEALKNVDANISNIVNKITGTIGDLSDSIEDLSDSLSDKNDDLDDAWDKVFDRFDNDEGWGKKDGYIYYYDDDGVSLKGVQKINGKIYYFNRIDGAMETGWQIVDGKRSYFDKKKGYQLSKQWVQDGEDWYFLDANGIVIKSDWVNYAGKVYYLKADGKMTKGWFKVKDYWYFFNDDGSMATSTWKWATDSWYYLKENGAAATDWLQLGGKWYCFKDPSGAMQTGWFRNNGKWYCSNEDGSMKTGWAYSEDGWCYLDEITGQMKKNEWVNVDGKYYYFNVNGIMVTGSRYVDGKKYVFNSDGILQ